MRAPDPLPQPGDWVATVDGSTYELVNHCEPVRGEACTIPAADATGCYVLLVDSGDVAWAAWADIVAVGDMRTADAAVEDAQ